MHSKLAVLSASATLEWVLIYPVLLKFSVSLPFRSLQPQDGSNSVESRVHFVQDINWS